jgi:hypothetical protein
LGLRCGAVAGPLFVLVLLAEDLLVPGFDIKRHLLSQLALGKFGWIQAGNFILCGLLNMLFGLTLLDKRSGEGRKALFLFVVLFGSFLVLNGLVHTDPGQGFPPGSLAPVRPSASGTVHAVGALLTFLALMGVLIAFVRHFLLQGSGRRALYPLACIPLVGGFFLYGITHPGLAGLSLQLAVLIGWTAPSVLAASLVRRERAKPPNLAPRAPEPSSRRLGTGVLDYRRRSPPVQPSTGASLQHE